MKKLLTILFLLVPLTGYAQVIQRFEKVVITSGANDALTVTGDILASHVTASFIGSLVGNASTATKLQTARTINGVSFDGSANIVITAQATNPLTIASTHLSGGSYDGSAPITIDTDATSANTASKIVARDSSGNFSAGTVTAALSGNVTIPTFTTGSVLFAGAGGLVSQDNVNFFWDATNHFLGMGTSTPTYSLDVQHTGGTGNGVVTRLKGLGATDQAIHHLENSDSSANLDMITYGSAVAGTLNGVAKARLTALVEYGGSGSALEIGTVDNVPIIFVANGAERMRVNASGVGVGITPSFELHVRQSDGTSPGFFETDRPNDNVSTALTLYKKRTSGTAVAGLGADLLFDTDNAAGTEVSAVDIQSSLSDVTAGAENGKFQVRVRAAGALGLNQSFLTTFSDGGTHLGADTQRDPGAHALGVDRGIFSGGTQAGSVTIYNTNDDAGNTEQLESFWTGNVAVIQTNKAGGSTAFRQLQIGTVGNATLTLFTNNGNSLTLDGSHNGHVFGSWTVDTSMSVTGASTFGTTSTSAVAKFQQTDVTTLGATPNVFITQRGNLNDLAQIAMGYVGGSQPDIVIAHQVTNAAGSTMGKLLFATRSVTTDTAPTERMTIHASGGVSVGSTPVDPSANNFTVQGTILSPAIKANSGNRYVCVDTTGAFVSQTTACSGT